MYMHLSLVLVDEMNSLLGGHRLTEQSLNALKRFWWRWNMAIMMNYFLQIIFNLNLSQMSSFYMQKHDCCKGFFLSILIKIKIFEG